MDCVPKLQTETVPKLKQGLCPKTANVDFVPKLQTGTLSQSFKWFCPKAADKDCVRMLQLWLFQNLNRDCPKTSTGLCPKALKRDLTAYTFLCNASTVIVPKLQQGLCPKDLNRDLTAHTLCFNNDCPKTSVETLSQSFKQGFNCAHFTVSY